MSGKTQEVEPRHKLRGAAKGKEGIEDRCCGDRSEEVEMVEGYLWATGQGELALGFAFGGYSQKTEVMVLNFLS